MTDKSLASLRTATAIEADGVLSLSTPSVAKLVERYRNDIITAGVPAQHAVAYATSKAGFFVPLYPDRGGAGAGFRQPVPASAFSDTTAVVDMAADARPEIDPSMWLKWLRDWSRGAVPLGVVTQGFAHIQGRVDFPSGFRGRGALSRAIERLGTFSGNAESFSGIPIGAGNDVALPVVGTRPDLRIVGFEMAFGVSPLNFSPYNLRITNDPTVRVAAMGPVPVTGIDRGSALIRTFTIRVYTPTVSIFIPLGYRETTANDETAAVDIGNAIVVDGLSTETAYFSAVTPAGVTFLRGCSFFASPDAPLTSTQITPACKGSPALMRALRSMELSQ